MILSLFMAACWTPQRSIVPAQRAEAPLSFVTKHADSPMTWVQLSTRAGSGYDPVGQEGLAYLTANMLVDGGTENMSPDDFDAKLNELASPIQVVVDKEQVSFRMRVLNEDLEDSAALFLDAFTHPLWDEQRFKTLQQQNRHFLTKGIVQRDESIGLGVLDAFLFSGHPYGHLVQGRVGSVPYITLDSVKSFFIKHYRKENTVLGIAGPMIMKRGGIDLGHSLSPVLQSLRLKLSEALSTELKHPETRKFVGKPEGRELLLIKKPSEAVGIHLGHPTDLNRAHPDWAALQLAVTALGAHRQSFGRLYRELREKRGLTYGCYSYIEHYRQAGGSRSQETGTGRVQNNFSIWVRPVSEDNAGFTLRAVLSIFEEFVENGLNEKEFGLIQNYLSRRTALWAKSPGRSLGWLVEAKLMKWPNPISALPATVKTLDRERVNSAIQRHLDPKNIQIAVVTGKPEEIFGQFEENVSDIVYTGEQPNTGSEQDLVDKDWAAFTLEFSKKYIRTVEEILK